MITSREPENWRDLQTQVARILEECQFSVEVERNFETARGTVEIDVYAIEEIAGRRYTVMVECKHWRANVPQSVIHGFRTVVADSGANVGYVISSSGFQTGAMTAAELTNLRLFTWTEFQLEFEQTWIERFLRHHIVGEIDPLFSLTEPLLPRWVNRLNEEGRRRIGRLRDQYVEFGWLMMMFTPYHIWTEPNVPELPLRDHLAPKIVESGTIPDAILDAPAYRDFLELAIPYTKNAIAEFHAVRDDPIFSAGTSSST